MQKRAKTTEDKKLFADRLREQREKKKLSQKELAAQLEITSAAISSWENAKTYPSKRNLTKVSSVFGITKDYWTGKSAHPLCVNELISNSDGILEPRDVKILGLSSDYRTEVGTILARFDTMQRKNLFELLCASKHFDDNEWKALILVAKAFSQCRIPTLKAYHPFTDFPTLKSFFYKTITVINDFKHDTTLGISFSTSSLESQLINFEYSLRKDFFNLHNPFRDTESIKSTLDQTNANIESIKRELRTLQLVPAENDKTGKINKRFQNAYIKALTNAYEDDIKNMAKFLGRLDEQNEWEYEPTI